MAARFSSLLVLFALATAFVAGCAKQESTSASAKPAKHEHHPPHSGTPVVLGDEVYHLELVRDAAAGKISVYVLDGEMENFIRTAAPSFEIVATVGGAKQTLAFKPVANPATGEKIGDTSLFEAQADWLKDTANFDAVLTSLDVRGTKFAGVAFNFPKGNDKD